MPRSVRRVKHSLARVVVDVVAEVVEVEATHLHFRLDSIFIARKLF